MSLTHPVQPVLPDYEGANLTGVVAGMMAPPGSRPDWFPEAARDAEQVVLVVLDGLGWSQMQERLASTPALAAMTGRPITSVAPTTTAVALTSLVVGAPPADHGIVGYRLLVDGPEEPEVMNVLKWRTKSGDARSFVDPAAFQVRPPFAGLPVPVVSKADFVGTGFTLSHQRGARQVGWYQASGLAVEVRGLVSTGEPFTYAYYDGIDRIAHIYGFGSHYDAELVAADRILEDLLDQVPSHVAVAVTADHGQVEVAGNVVELAPEVMDQVSIVSGEPRFRWLHGADPTEPGTDRLARLAENLYGDQAWVATYAQVEAEGWLGGPIRPEFRRRLGDVAIVPFAPVAYLEPGEAAESKLVCRHGSLTEDEMRIPLVAARGRLGS